MEYLCIAHLGLYGYAHGLALCLGCKLTYCKCIESLTPCCSCSTSYCMNCVSQLGHLSKIDLCGCLICTECNDQNTYIEHGGKCPRFAGRFKSLLYPAFIVDVVDLVSEFLWTSSMRYPSLKNSLS